MTIDEAIAHCRANVNICEGKCKEEHEQLADWLEELKSMKQKKYRPFRDTDELIKVWDAKYRDAYGLERINNGLDMPHIWVRSKFNKDHKGCLITNFFDKYVLMNNQQCFLSRLFDEYTFLDGSVCGVEA